MTWLKRAGIAFLALTIGVAGYYAYSFYKFFDDSGETSVFDKFQNQPPQTLEDPDAPDAPGTYHPMPEQVTYVEPAKEKWEDSGRINILLLGGDSRGLRPNEIPRTDTMMILSIDTVTKKAHLLSLLRDTYVKIPGHGSNRINTAVVYGGPNLAMKTVSELTGLNIQYYVYTDFQGFIHLIDEIGGIEFEVEKDMYYSSAVDGPEYDIDLKAGLQVLGGKEALQYVRFRFDARSDYSSLLLREGSFNDIGDGITVYVRSREADGELRGIMLHDTRDKDNIITLMAERGRLAMTDEGPRVILVNGNRQQVDRKEGKLSILYFERYSVDLGAMTQKQTQRWRDPSERYLHELFLPPEQQPADRMALNRLHAEGHSRLTTPLLAFAFTLLSLAALLSGEFNRRGQSRRVLAAIVIAAILQAATIALTNLIVRWPILTPLAYINIVAIAGISLWWMMRTGAPVRREPLPNAAS